MLRYENSQSSADVGSLMQMAAAMSELTSHFEDLPRIPKVLASFLGLEFMTFGLVRVQRGIDPEIVTLASSDPVKGHGGSTLPPAAVLTQPILQIARRREFVARTPVLPALQSAEADGGADAEATNDSLGLGRQLVLTRDVNATHRMIIIVHQSPAGPGLDGAATEMLHLLSNQLAAALRLLLGAMEYPPSLGEDFSAITEREWTVLWGLNSADGEKQLADRMGLSPHTLHSHIKSIYRKLGVQGRLPLTQRLRLALQDYRLRILPVVLPPSPVERAAC